MNLSQRIRKTISALFSMLSAVLLFIAGENAYRLVSIVLSITLIVSGIRDILFYFTMARKMVDGKGILYKGVLVLDVGIFTLSVRDESFVFIVLYLLGIYAFSGVVNVLRALQERRFHAPSWRLNMAEGLLNIVFAAGAVVFGFIQKDMRHLTWIYASGLFYSSILRLISAFRKSAIIYIP